jgi:hypothetical protein
MQTLLKIRREAAQHPDLYAVLAIVLIALLAYLPGLENLGYYRDDWHVTWGGTLLGPQKIFDLHLTDRPLMGVLYAGVFSVLGNASLNWHVYSLVLRILGAIAVYAVLSAVWRQRKSLNGILAALFVVYPGFLQMPTASAYSNHLLGLLCGFLAILITLSAYNKKKSGWKIALLFLSTPFALICFGIMEWMMGMEVILIVLLGLRIAVDFPFRWSWAWFNRLIFFCLPSLAVFLIFYAWRLFFFSSARSVTDVRSLGTSYLQHPLDMLLRLIVEPLRGFWNSLVLAWGVPFYDLSSNVPAPAFLAALACAAIGVLLFLRFLQFKPETEGNPLKSATNDNWQMLVCGAVFILAAIIPVVIGNREVLLQNTFDRYTLLASFGVMLMIGGGFSLLFTQRMQRIFMAGLLCIAIMTQVLNTRYFAEFWETQRQVWWQLSWRAPALQKGTVLLPYLPLKYRLAESYEVWGPANLIYHTQDALEISGEVINQQTLHWIRSGDSYGKTIRRVDVTMDFSNALLLGMPGDGSCLHVYGKEYNVISEFDDVMMDYLTPFSSWAQIIPDGEPAQVSTAIFGEEPAHGWCYAYQKAALAYQKEDWAEIVRLGDEAAAHGLQPTDEMEWLPFYEAYARTGRFDDANRIGEVLRINKSISEQFCAVYQPKLTTLDDQEEYMVVNICPQFSEE